MKQYGVLIMISSTTLVFAAQYTHISLSKIQMQHIGTQIWRNECNCTTYGLTCWNEGEEFLSLGIGHFIWYQKNKKGPYTETFPKLLSFFEQNNIKLPNWLKKYCYCPWTSKKKFMVAFNTDRMQKLRKLLTGTIDLQVKFIVQRLEQVLPNMLKHIQLQKYFHIRKQFHRVARSNPNGLYALIDYINFKGEGTNPKERYNGKGWGLLYVLERMQGTSIGQSVVREFAKAATYILKQRAACAPKTNMTDKQFLPGWINRIKTYTSFTIKS